MSQQRRPLSARLVSVLHRLRRPAAAVPAAPTAVATPEPETLADRCVNFIPTSLGFPVEASESWAADFRARWRDQLSKGDAEFLVEVDEGQATAYGTTLEYEQVAVDTFGPAEHAEAMLGLIGSFRLDPWWPQGFHHPETYVLPYPLDLASLELLLADHFSLEPHSHWSSNADYGDPFGYRCLSVMVRPVRHD